MNFRIKDNRTTFGAQDLVSLVIQAGDALMSQYQIRQVLPLLLALGVAKVFIALETIIQIFAWY